MNLPPFPNVPTDNLYKFAAISSLIACLISFLGIFYLFIEIDKQYSEAIAELNYEQRVRQRDSSWLAIDTIFRREMRDDELAWSKSSKDSIEILRNYVSYKRRISDSLRKIEVQERADRQPKEIRREVLMETADFRAIMATILAVLGVVSFHIAVTYFQKWYRNHQIYHDEILKNQARQLTKKNY